MYDFSSKNTSFSITDLFIKAYDKHNNETRFSSYEKFYIRTSRLNQNQRSFASFRAKLWNSLSVETRKLPKQMLFSIFEAEEDCVEASILIRLLANWSG